MGCGQISKVILPPGTLTILTKYQSDGEFILNLRDDTKSQFVLLPKFNGIFE